jgi:hypothetical protein
VGFERIYSITDFWDGPRAGAADYSGTPHFFRSVWRAHEDDWDLDRFFLHPISPEEAAWEAESWAIWRRFAAFYRGRQAPAPENPADWGALPEDLDRHHELRKLLAVARNVSKTDCIVATGVFRTIDGSITGFVAPLLEVEWAPASILPDDQLVSIPAI